MEESCGWKTERGSPQRGKRILETMPAPWRRMVYENVENGVFQRDGDDTESEGPMATINRILQRTESNDKQPTAPDMPYDSDDSDDESDHDHAIVTKTMLAPATTPEPTPSLTLPSAVRTF